MLSRLSFLWLFFYAVSIHAQQPATIHLTEKDNLPDIDFYDILEDQKKFIWLAADKGLYRYNGREYQYFSHPNQKGNAVFGTLEDNKGKIWCNNIYGQFFYTEKKELKLFVDLSPMLNGELSQFKVTPKALIVFTGRKIITVDLETKKIRFLYNKNSYRVGLALQSQRGYFHTTENYIIQTDDAFNKIDSLYIDIYDTHDINSITGLPNIVSNGHISFCHFIRYSKNTFYQFDVAKKKLKKISIPNKLKKRKINQVFFKNDDIWIATDSGIHIFSLIDDTLAEKEYFLKDYFITKIIKDSHQNYWITTKGNGIFVMPNIYVFEYHIPEHLTSVNKLKKIENSKMLFGTNKGAIGSLNSTNGSFKILDETSSYRISEIIKGHKKNEFIIAKEDVAFRYYSDKQRLETIAKSVVFGAKSLSKINDLGYVLSSYKDAVLLDNDFKIIKKLVNKRSYTNYFSNATKHIYIGTIEGFFVFNTQLLKTEIKHNGNTIAATSITEAKDNTLWVATFKNGIYEIKDNTVVRNYTKNNGLLSNKTGIIQSDENGLWISTEKGIQFLDYQTRTFKNLTRQNGIPSYRITDIEIENNIVIFSSNSGLFGLYKNNVFDSPQQKDIYFEDISINETAEPIKPSYKLDYNQNKIRFTFNVNGFQSAINTRYEYRLLGLEKNWIDAKEQVNTVNYNSLPSGNYTFQVRVADEAETLKSITFSISKPLWKLWWFYLLVMVVMALATYSLFKLKIKKLKIKQNEALQKEIVNKQLVLSQLENLRSQMNPHFIFNALNSIQEYIVLNEKELASSFLIKFSRLIRIYLEHSRENEVTLKEELNALQIYLELEKNRFEDVLDYTITVSKNIDKKNIKLPSLFIQPYVENALKHGLLHKKDNRELHLIFNLNEKEDILVCEITDNGIGIEASKELNKKRQPMHRSFASSANEKRVQLLNTNRKRKIKVNIAPLDPKTKTGTRVLITIPI